MSKLAKLAHYFCQPADELLRRCTLRPVVGYLFAFSPCIKLAQYHLLLTAPVHRPLRRPLQPIGFTEQLVGGYVLLRPAPLLARPPR